MANNEEIGRRIETRRKSLGLTLDDVASSVGVTKSTIQRYEKGKITKLKLPVLEAIASSLTVDPAWLCYKTDRMAPITERKLPSNILPLPKTYRVPLIGTIACGKPILAVEEAEEFVDVTTFIDATFALRCKGDSMINARIFDGDIVYIRSQPEVENGEIAAVRIGEDATLKKVYYTGSRVVLRACNPLFADQEYEGDQLDEIEILGKAVAFTSAIR